MSHREQALIDQFRAWRAATDALPEPPWQPPESRSVPSRETRMAEARERRAARLAAPLATPAPTPADRPEPAQIVKISRLELAMTAEDAEFAAWKRSRRAFHAGRARGGRSRRR